MANFFIFILILLLSSSIYAQSTHDSTAVEVLNRAYDLLNTNPTEAAKLFARVVEIQPSNIVARRQLGYLYLAQEKQELALEQFQASERLRSSDTISLQIAYLLVSLGRRDEANKIFHQLQNNGDQSIKEKASEELAASSANQAPSRRWIRLYTDPYYDTRWEDLFIHFNFQDGYHLTEDQKITAYGVMALSTDTKSKLGVVPQIISDHTLLIGAGIRLKPLYGLSLMIQEGVVFDLIRRGSDGDPQNDFRAVAIYGNGLYAPFNVHPDLKLPMYPFADMYSSFGYYSRYKNEIGYLQTRGGLRALEVSRTAVDVYVRGDFVFDTEREFYNNIIEGGFGVNITPNINWGLNIRAEYHRGKYLNVSSAAELQRAALYDQFYNSFRFYFIFERTF